MYYNEIIYKVEGKKDTLKGNVMGEKIRNLQLLVKPVSNQCNMNCRYCFYQDVSEERETAFRGIMGANTAETIIKKAVDAAKDSCTFGFQGGEPTLAGIGFYENWTSLVEKYNKNKIRICYTIQTNGLEINQDWIDFFLHHDFLVGLSIDGSGSLHDNNRKDKAGEGTFKKVLAAGKNMQRQGVPVNILCVLTNKNSNKIKRIYQFFKEEGFYYHQYLPCLDSLHKEKSPWSLAQNGYETALKELFDLWYADRMKALGKGSEPVHIRQFENWVYMLLGGQPEACTQYGRCTLQHVIEADGTVYPCDFYALDEYDMGNIDDYEFVDFMAMAEDGHTPAGRFLEEGKKRSEKCSVCRWYPLCRGGCRRDYVDGRDNGYCRAYKNFFVHAIEGLEQLAATLDKN